ncbi:MAG: Fe-S cluster assembly ATPase SufC [Alphaproteobacteria bacterium]
MLEIKNLHVSIDGMDILRGLDLSVEAGEIHAIMGPNGSGKSTLAHVLSGREGYEVTKGEVSFQGQDLLAMTPEDRSRAGVFLGFQYPVEIPGVAGSVFVKAAVNAVRKARGEPEFDAMEFLMRARDKLGMLKMDESFISRPINVGFSGGEKKRNEIFQMAMLEPTLAVLDETDSGLDIDALRIVAEGINSLRAPDRATILITHYQRLLDYVLPDHIHILAAGRIVETGGKELASLLEEKGYAAFGVESDIAVAS